MASALHPRQRDARRAVWTLLAVFLAGQGAAGVAVDRMPEHLRFPELARALDQVRGGRAVDVLLLGTSRTMPLWPDFTAAALHRVRPGEPPPAVANLAVPAGDALVSDYALGRVLALGARPRLVVAEVAPEEVSARSIFVNGTLVRVLRWSDILDLLPELHLAHAASTLASTRLIPAYTYRAAFRAWARGGDLTHGEFPPPQVLAYNVPGQREGAEMLGRRLRQAGPGGLPGRGLERLVARCRAAGVPLLLLVPPATSVLRAEYTPEIEAAFQAFLRARAPGVPVIDRRAAFPDRDFTDVYHLQPGAVPSYIEGLAPEIARVLPAR